MPRVGYTAIVALTTTDQYDQVLKLLERGPDIDLTTRTGNSFTYRVLTSIPAESHPQFRHRLQVIKILQDHGVVLQVLGPRELPL